MNNSQYTLDEYDILRRRLQRYWDFQRRHPDEALRMREVRERKRKKTKIYFQRYIRENGYGVLIPTIPQQPVIGDHLLLCITTNHGQVEEQHSAGQSRKRKRTESPQASNRQQVC